MTISIGAILPVGTIIHSMLSVAQFESEYGNNWVIADGRSVTGTLYASVTGISSIPDMRGAFLRSKGSVYNPDGDLALGTYSADKFGSHGHGQNYGNQLPLYASPAGGLNPGLTAGNIVGGSPTRLYTDNTGSNETAPKSITVNIFIRIN